MSDLEEQETMTKEEILSLMEAEYGQVFDLDNMPKQGHIWTDRGLKLTCENAGHPAHEAWKRGKPTV